MIENIKKVEILREGYFFSDGRVIGRNYRYKGGGGGRECVTVSGSSGGHPIFKWCHQPHPSPLPHKKMNGPIQ